MLAISLIISAYLNNNHNNKCDFPSSSPEFYKEVKGDIDFLALSLSGVSLADVWLHPAASMLFIFCSSSILLRSEAPQTQENGFSCVSKCRVDDVWVVSVQVAQGKLLIAPMKWLKFKHAECILPHLKQERCYSYCALLTFTVCSFLFRVKCLPVESPFSFYIPFKCIILL